MVAYYYNGGCFLGNWTTLSSKKLRRNIIIHEIKGLFALRNGPLRNKNNPSVSPRQPTSILLSKPLRKAVTKASNEHRTIFGILKKTTTPSCLHSVKTKREKKKSCSTFSSPCLYVHVLKMSKKCVAKNCSCCRGFLRARVTLSLYLFRLWSSLVQGLGQK